MKYTIIFPKNMEVFLLKTGIFTMKISSTLSCNCGGNSHDNNKMGTEQFELVKTVIRILNNVW